MNPNFLKSLYAHILSMTFSGNLQFDPCANNYSTWHHNVVASLAFLHAMACFKTVMYLLGIPSKLV